jgi:hypothetical protein
MQNTPLFITLSSHLLTKLTTLIDHFTATRIGDNFNFGDDLHLFQQISEFFTSFTNNTSLIHTSTSRQLINNVAAARSEKLVRRASHSHKLTNS